MNTKIKICGLFRPEDIDAVNIAKPDYIGFIFYPKSHRYVDMDKAAALKARLCGDIKTVGVFVNVPPEEIADIAENVPLDIVQLHGDEDNAVIGRVKELCPRLSEVWKAVRVRGDFDREELKRYSLADRLVLDAYVEGYGGQGKSIDLDLLRGIGGERIILAGGLGFENIKTAIETVKPYCVDLSSSVETDKQKDRGKIIKIVDLVRN